MALKCAIILTVLSALSSCGFTKIQNLPLETIAEWNFLEFGFLSEADRDDAISSGNLNPQSAPPLDVALSPNEKKTFLTIPRFSTGVPYSLAVINRKGLKGPNGPILHPYPSYEWHNKYNSSCDGIVSAFRVAITECKQMWVIDSGLVGDTQYCPPQLLVFDLRRDKLIHRYRFDRNVYTPTYSMLINLVAMVKVKKRQCQQTMVYIADVSNPGLIVYDYAQNRAWRVTDKWMHPDPEVGQHIDSMDGIFGLTTNKKNFFFHPLASLNEISVPLSQLNDENMGENDFKKLGSRESACTVEAIDSKDNIYCVTLNPIKLISWNVNSSEYSPKTFTEIPIDPSLLNFVSGMKIIQQRDGKEYLWMMSNNLQKFSSGTLDANEVNLRILRRSLEDV